MSAPNPPAALDWGDPAAVNAWALDVYTQARDAIGAGLDATASKPRRVLSRAEARKAIREANGALRMAFAFAGVLPDATPPARDAPDAPREAPPLYWRIVFAVMRRAAETESADLAESAAKLVSARRVADDARFMFEGLRAYLAAKMGMVASDEEGGGP